MGGEDLDQDSIMLCFLEIYLLVKEQNKTNRNQMPEIQERLLQATSMQQFLNLLEIEGILCSEIFYYRILKHAFQTQFFALILYHFAAKAL